MTCFRIPGGIICVNPWGRLHMGNKYIWVDFHEYCGPAFYTDSNMSKLYDPKDEDDPIWPLFITWLDKYHKAKDANIAKRIAVAKKDATC